MAARHSASIVDVSDFGHHDGAPFFVMDRVAGRVPPDIMPYTFGSWLSQASRAEQARLQAASVGILAALRVRTGGSRRHRWTVPVACVVLLAMLGAGQGTDVLAHILGLGVGAALGFVAAVFRNPLPARMQPYLAAAALLAIAASWLLALDSR